MGSIKSLMDIIGKYRPNYKDVSISMDSNDDGYTMIKTALPYDEYISSRGDFTSYNDNKIPVIQQSIGIMNNCGTSTWILKSSIVNPECIIVYRNEDMKRQHEHEFNRLVSQDPVFNGLYEHNGCKRPIFTTVDNLLTTIRGRRLPLIFDPECFY